MPNSENSNLSRPYGPMSHDREYLTLDLNHDNANRQALYLLSELAGSEDKHPYDSENWSCALIDKLEKSPLKQVGRRVMVTGSRKWPASQRKIIEETFRIHLSPTNPADSLLHGGAEGADTFAGDFWSRHKLNVQVMRPEYDKYKPEEKWKAPLDRDEVMVMTRPDLIFVFRVANGDNLHGTTRTMEMAYEKGYVGVFYDPYYKEKLEVFILARLEYFAEFITTGTYDRRTQEYNRID